jgi:hemoglobin
MTLKNIFQTIALFVALSISTSMTAHATEKTMYDTLGGKEAISVVVDDFIGLLAADERINAYFANANVPAVKGHLVDLMCMATGGPCKYTGRDMKTIHAGMGITNAHFNALAECLYQALDQNGVPYHMQNQLMAMLAPMQRDVVTK